MKFLITFAVVLIFYTFGCESAVIECQFDDIEHYGYGCNMLNSDSVTLEDDREISEIRGQHKRGKSNDDVKFINSFATPDIEFFPRGLSKHFKNLEMIQITHVHLGEITKDDLKPFGDKLKELRLDNNKIKHLEADLFKFSKNLNHIVLNRNQISNIENGAFNGLEKLNILFLESNPCTTENDYAINNRQKVLELIKKVETKCNQ